MKTICGLLCCSIFLLLSLPVSAQWQRIVVSGKGEKTDIPQPHPLSYWTVDPLARDDGGDLCIDCHTQDGQIVTKQDYKTTTEVNHLGSLSGSAVVELLVHVTGDRKEFSSRFIWKLLLIQIGPDQYLEIYHLQTMDGTFQPFHHARILTINDESVLTTYDPDDGNGGGCSKGHWIMGKTGLQSLDFDAVYKAMGNRLPHNATYRVDCWSIDLEHQKISTWAQRTDATCHACGGIGKVTATFTLHGAKAEPGVIEFFPDTDTAP